MLTRKPKHHAEVRNGMDLKLVRRAADFSLHLFVAKADQHSSFFLGVPWRTFARGP
jgi:hypothetical protein